MNDPNSDVNSGVSSERPEFVWTVLGQTTTQKPVRKTDTNRTDRDSEDQECFSCVVGTCTDVECAKQDVVSLSAIQSESYTLNTGGAHTISPGLQVAMTTCTNPSSGVTIASTLRPSTKSGPETMAT